MNKSNRKEKGIYGDKEKRMKMSKRGEEDEDREGMKRDER